MLCFLYVFKDIHFQYSISCVECFVNHKNIFFQALLSAHDTVSLRDYEPDLPALPKDLPEDEEAMRIVCLVKNNQPLVSMNRQRSGRQI